MSRIVITYRQTSRMSIRIVQNGDVHVSAPIGTPKATVQKFISDERSWIEGALKRSAERMQRRQEFFDRLPLLTQEQCREATERLNAIIPPMVERNARRMGVHPRGIRYSATVSKWGSCHSKTHVLQFSAYLLLLPEWCIEHVVVHELCHLLVPNHGPRFHALMDKYFPRWREARTETIRISRMDTESE